MPENVKKRVIRPEKSIALPFQRKKQLEQDIKHITEEMYRRNKELADTNKTLSLLRMIDALVLESHASLKEVCMQITNAITSVTEYPFAGIFIRSPRANDELSLYGWSSRTLIEGNADINIEKPVHLGINYPWLEEKTTGRLISLESMPHEQIATYLNCPVFSIDHFLKQLPLKSVYVIKLRVRRHLVGLLVVGFFNSDDQLSETEISLLDRLSETIGVALDNKLLFEENRRVLRQLKESNAKLRALDEAKDDFISMASHQLRTPLTSVKGYISMLMEGDAGKLNKSQQQMLGQAFFSSQRMVYLIADMLNVSRLRTGKFIIENTPVNLAEVVEQEMEQLKETATAHKVKLIYNRPKDFPTLLLDETKMRQVIMNFADNAIYYTPSGGEITVELKNLPNTIELRVTDNGIGVPKSEKHHLFTKFYRAGNARKARPDGTGLGLFMAKKVIVSQGGALIFESEEGQGSTFGFIFNKANLIDHPPEVVPQPKQPVSASKP